MFIFGWRVLSHRFSFIALTLGLAVSATTASGDDKAKSKNPFEEMMTGDWGGSRTVLKSRGIDVGIVYINETLGVLSGGVRRAASYQGRLEASIDSDLEKLIGWSGASTHVKAFQIHTSKRNIAANVASIANPSNIDALGTTRLFTAWFQQNFSGDMISVRAGQLAGDDEFFTSTTAGGLINGTFGWGSVLAANIRSGGPAYPLATPGVRVQLKPSSNVTILGAVFTGDPAGPNCSEPDADPQRCNRHGTTFSFHGGELWMGEVQYAINQGVWKLGGWYASADYADQRFGVDSATGAVLSLADPALPDPLNHKGNWGIYGVMDQAVWRAGEQAVNVFARSGMSPTDRNLVSFYIDGGIGFTGLIAGRGDDVLTLGAAHSKISRRASKLDRDTLAFNGPPYPIRDGETVLELSYAMKIRPWWVVQPDIQYLFHPGGRIPNPENLSRTQQDALVAGLRSTIRF